jgi:two-component system LytT family response regulator
VTEIKQKENTLHESVLKPKQLQVAGKITIPVQNGFEVMEVVDILYCQVDDNYTNIFLTDGEKLVSKTPKYFEEILKPSVFVRVHKSYLVNVNAIIEYRKGRAGVWYSLAKKKS